MKKTIITSVTALVLGVSLSHAGGCGGSKGSSYSSKKTYTESKSYSKPKTYTRSTYQKPVKYVSHDHHYDRGGEFQISLNHGLGDPSREPIPPNSPASWPHSANFRLRSKTNLKPETNQRHSTSVGWRFWFLNSHQGGRTFLSSSGLSAETLPGMFFFGR